MTMVRNVLSFGTAALAGALLVAGCAPPEDQTGSGVQQSSAAASTSLNGLNSINGLNSLNGLSQITGLSSQNGVITADGQKTFSYIVRCALPATQTITLKDGSGNPLPFPGELGMAPQWANGACDQTCQQQISACILAHVNTTGIHISLWLDGDSPALGWGQSASYPQQEGSFFGNIFTSPPTMYYCNGKDFDVGVVPGRIGAGQSGAPYSNPFPGSGYCKDNCAAQDYPNQNDGYKACHGWNHVVTVWRNAAADSLLSSTTSTTTVVTNSVTTTTAATTTTTTTSSGFSGIYTIQPASNSSLTLGVAGGSTANGAAFQQLSGIADFQKFNFVSMGNGYYKLTMKSAPNKCLDNPWNGTDGARLWTWDCTGQVNQQWQFVPDAQAGVYTIKNAQSGRCIDVTGGSTASGNQMQVYSCQSGNNNQRFYVKSSS